MVIMGLSEVHVPCGAMGWAGKQAGRAGWGGRVAGSGRGTGESWLSVCRGLKPLRQSMIQRPLLPLESTWLLWDTSVTFWAIGLLGNVDGGVHIKRPAVRQTL